MLTRPTSRRSIGSCPSNIIRTRTRMRNPRGAPRNDSFDGPKRVRIKGLWARFFNLFPRLFMGFQALSHGVQAFRKPVRRRFAEVRDAYEILNDPDKKILYDTGGMEAVKKAEKGEIEKGEDARANLAAPRRKGKTLLKAFEIRRISRGKRAIFAGFRPHVRSTSTCF